MFNSSPWAFRSDEDIALFGQRVYIKRPNNRLDPNSRLQLRLCHILPPEDIIAQGLDAQVDTLWCPKFKYTTKIFKLAIYQHSSMAMHPDQVNALHYEKRKRATTGEEESVPEASHKVERQVQKKKQKRFNVEPDWLMSKKVE